MLLLLACLPVASALLPNVVLRRRGASLVASASELYAPPPRATSAIYDFESDESAAGAWERIDDVVMGGVSSSRLVAAGECARWSGTVRTDGGGFCGARTVAFDAPLDLSAYEGLFIDAVLESDDEPERRAWKLTLRSSSDRSEVVHSVEWQPPVGARAPVYVPFSDFRLVRGPRVVVGAEPLSAEKCAEVFGLGMTISKFTIGEGNTTTVENFRDGPFKLALYGLGAYSSTSQAAAALKPPPPKVRSDNSAGSPVKGPGGLVMSALRPLASFVFSEKARRRGQARSLLARNGKARGDWSARLWGQRVVKRGVKRMTGPAARLEGLRQLLRDTIATVLAFPLRLAFKCIFALARAVKRIRNGKPKLQMPRLE